MTEELDFKSLFNDRVQSLVDLITATDATQLYLNRRREGTTGYTPEWDVVLVQPPVEDTTPVETKKTRKKKS